MYKKGADKLRSSQSLSSSQESNVSYINIGSKDSISDSSSEVTSRSSTAAEPEPPHQTPHSTFKSQASQGSKDLMISYSHADKDIMMRVKESLEQNGISVWVDVSGLTAGVDFLSKIGEAIIDCKLFLSLLSSNSVSSKYCQDELALAYVSNRAIFPLSIDKAEELYPLMDTGMKLQLARYEWIHLGSDPNQFEENFDKLLVKLKDELLQQQKQQEQDEKAATEESRTEPDRPPLVRQTTRHNLNRKQQSSHDVLDAEHSDAESFWKEHFGAKDEIEWTTFESAFRSFYSKNLTSILNKSEQDWLMNVLSREMEVEDGILYKFNLLAFCNVEGVYQSLWERTEEQAREDLAMKEVFDMESSVRVEAIENLGKFHSAAVVGALRDLLSDRDANARAVAAVSLARTNTNDPVTCKFLMKTLNDKDRLVREAGCLALGHLQVKGAVNQLLHMWRNDVISHVREAANVALQQIGGPEVEKAMRVTKVLADEIRQLTAS